MGTDKMTRFVFVCIQLLHELQQDGTAITAIAVTHSGQMIMVGTSAGTVRVIQYSLQIGNNWTEHQAHSGPITHMVISSHDRFLLTASEDGSLLIWTITDHIGHKLGVWKEIDQDEEVLCTRGYLEKKVIRSFNSVSYILSE